MSRAASSIHRKSFTAYDRGPTLRFERIPLFTTIVRGETWLSADGVEAVLLLPMFWDWFAALGETQADWLSDIDRQGKPFRYPVVSKAGALALCRRGRSGAAKRFATWLQEQELSWRSYGRLAVVNGYRA